MSAHEDGERGIGETWSRVLADFEHQFAAHGSAVDDDADDHSCIK